MTHTGTDCAISGSGGPKVAPLSEPAPVSPLASHTGLVLASHPVRQSFTLERGGVGKLCEMPVHPLSRSLPASAVERSISSGPPWGFFPQATLIMPPGLQWRMSLSGSFFGEPLLVALTRIVAFPVFFLPFFVTLIGTMTSAESPHVVPVRSAGAVGSVRLFGFPLIFSAVSGGCGVQPLTFGSV